MDCTWKARPSDDSACKAVDTAPLRRPNFKPCRPPNEEDRDFLLRRLSSVVPNSPMIWLLRKETCTRPTLPDKFLTEAIIENISPTASLYNKDEILHLAELTQGQRLNEFWSAARQGRLTASNFGRVLKNIYSKNPPKSPLITSLVDPKPLDGVMAINYGISNEESA